MVIGKGFKEKALGLSPVKSRVNSKQKGNRNEVEAAKALTQWTGYTFRRTPASGAIHVPLDWLCGDVFCTSRELDFPFSVETKHYKQTTDKLIAKWWDQTCVDAERIEKLPMLMYRANDWPAKTWWIILRMHRIALTKLSIPTIPFDLDLTVNSIHSNDLFSVAYNEFVKSLRL